MDRLSRAEIESSVDSFPDLDYKFEHIDWADIMDAEEGSNPDQKLQVLHQQSVTIHSSLHISQTSVSFSAMPALTSLRLDDSSRGLPPLKSEQPAGKSSNGPVPTSFSGVFPPRNPIVEPTLTHNSPSNNISGVFKVPAAPKQPGRLSLDNLKPLDVRDRKSGNLRPPPSPSSTHDKKRLKFSNNSDNKDWDYVDDDFIFTTDTEITPTNYNSFRLPIPHSASVSTLESDTEIETCSAYSDTSSTSTLTSKRSKRREELPTVVDPHKLEQRQKQLDYGKNTDGYCNYIKLYPKFKREPGMPKTPDKTIGYSHNRWLGLLKKWRKALHRFDPLDGPPKIPTVKHEAIPMYLEDANASFPILPVKVEPEPEDIVKTENFDEDAAATPFSYSLVLQNLNVKTEPPLPYLQKDSMPSSVKSMESDENAQIPTSNQSTPIPPTEDVPTGPMTYSAVLKAPKPICIVPQPVISPEPVPIIKQDMTENAVVTEKTDLQEDVPNENALEDQENIPPAPKPTYSQVLLAPKPLNPVTSPPILDVTPQVTTPLPPEDVPLPGEDSSDSDDSMQVDSQIDTPVVETTFVNSALIQEVSQSLSYSQALRSKPMLNPTPNIFKTNDTAEKEELLEKKNELKDSQQPVASTMSEDNLLKQEVIISQKETDISCNIDPSPLTYSQVLSGVRSPVETITDKPEIETDTEDLSLEPQTSKPPDTHPPPPPPHTSYRHLIPQNTIVSIKEQS